MIAIKDMEEMPNCCLWDCPLAREDGGACQLADVRTNDKKRPDDFRQLAEWLTDYKRLLEQKPCEEVSEKLQKIEQIIKEHDEDRMPEDYFYIDKIREVLEDDSN